MKSAGVSRGKAEPTPSLRPCRRPRGSSSRTARSSTANSRSRSLPTAARSHARTSASMPHSPGRPTARSSLSATPARSRSATSTRHPHRPHAHSSISRFRSDHSRLSTWRPNWHESCDTNDCPRSRVPISRARVSPIAGLEAFALATVGVWTIPGQG